MLVNRRTFIAKRGCFSDVAALLKEAADLVGLPRPARIYLSEVGSFDTIAIEAEYENYAEYERFMALHDTKLSAQWWEKWFAVTESGGRNEIWKLLD